jgi:transposase-like protein
VTKQNNQTKGYATMKKNNVIEVSSREGCTDPLMELIRQGARKLIEQALESELEGYMDGLRERRLPDGRAAVVRNGYQPERDIQTGIGPVPVKVPKVRAKDGQGATFRSALVPPYVRKSRSLSAALPWLYLKGISTGEMDAALEVLVGPDAKGLSASTVARLKREWASEYTAWRTARVDRDQWVYIWADGIYSGLRAEDAKLCALVIIGVNEQGEKRFLAIEDGVRESTQSWREVLLGLKARGMNSPKLAIGDGAMGFWAALDEVYSDTRQQRCWLHKMNNVLNRVPKSVQPKMKQSLYDIWQAETKQNAEQAFDQFAALYDAKYPKAVECLYRDRHELLTFYDFPALHWQSIRTTNPIESTFATIRHRTTRAKGCLSRDGMLHMLFKLGQSAEKTWRRQRGFDVLAKVITGVQFKDGIEIDTANQIAA